MVSATIIRGIIIRSGIREIEDTTEFRRKKGMPLHEAERGIEGDSQRKRYLSLALKNEWGFNE